MTVSPSSSSGNGPLKRSAAGGGGGPSKKAYGGAAEAEAVEMVVEGDNEENARSKESESAASSSSSGNGPLKRNAAGGGGGPSKKAYGGAAEAEAVEMVVEGDNEENEEDDDTIDDPVALLYSKEAEVNEQLESCATFLKYHPRRSQITNGHGMYVQELIRYFKHFLSTHDLLSDRIHTMMVGELCELMNEYVKPMGGKRSKVSSSGGSAFVHLVSKLFNCMCKLGLRAKKWTPASTKKVTLEWNGRHVKSYLDLLEAREVYTAKTFPEW